MKLIYENNSISTTTTHNKQILKYQFQKLYYAIIIKECNRYSSIGNKQRIDMIMTNDDLKIIAIKREMHENTVYENLKATTTILLPLNYFKTLKIGNKFMLENNNKINSTVNNSKKNKANVL